MSKTITKKKPVPIAVLQDQRAAHVAGILIDGRTFRLSFWTDAEWKALPAGEYEGMNLAELSGFGKVSIEPIAGNEWLNTLSEGYGHGPRFPSARSFDRIHFDVGEPRMGELMDAITRHGALHAMKVLERDLAEKDLDHEYWRAASEADAERATPKPVYYRVTTEDREYSFLARRGMTLDDAIQEEIDDLAKPLATGESWNDMTVWQDDRILAVISHDENGQPRVTKFDGSGPASQFDVGELLGIETPAKGEVLLNAQPSKKTRRQSKPKAKLAAKGR